ncbi:MAG: hypothetical protein DRP46_14295 [Candidatus Zixiibacteriota bacterium]|nr:MAG: hypothetical protein DRP46_14295 [candidate division Zixibacteria bacterium]
MLKDSYMDEIDQVPWEWLSHEERKEVEFKLRKAMQDPRYKDPSQREPAFVKAVDEAWRRLYPGKAELAPLGPRRPFHRE